jgi:hypothetical protein
MISSFVSKTLIKRFTALSVGYLTIFGVALFVINIIYPAWFINPEFHIDPWIYWGTGENLQYAAKHFGSTYYFRRWTLTLPNYLFQQLFDPYLAQSLLRGLLFIGICSLGAVFIWSVTKNRLAIVFYLIFISSTEYIIRSIGTSYNQGTGILLFLGILILARSKVDLKTCKCLPLAFGLMSLLLFVTYQWTVYLFPGILTASFFYHFTCLAERRISAYIYCTIWTAVGFSAGLVVDLLVGMILGVRWENLLTYSLGTALGFIRSGDYAVPLNVYKNSIFSASSFPFLALVFMAKNLVLSRIVAISPNYFVIAVVLPLTIVHFMDPLLGANTTFTPQTNLYLAILLCIWVIITISNIYTKFKSPIYKWLLLLSFVVIVVGFQNNFFTLNNNQWLQLLGLSFVILIFTYFALKFWEPRSSYYSLFRKLRTNDNAKANTYLHHISSLMVILAILITTSCLMSTMQRWASGQRATYLSSSDAARFIKRLSQEHRTLTNLPGQPRLWLADFRPHSEWSVNISALYGLYSAVAVGYPPPPPSCDQMNWIQNTKNSLIVIFKGNSDEEAAKYVDDAAIYCGYVGSRLSIEPQQNTYFYRISLPDSSSAWKIRESGAGNFPLTHTLVVQTSALQQNGYGWRYRLEQIISRWIPRYFAPPQLIELNNSDFIFKPNSMRDHLASEFLSVRSTENRKVKRMSIEIDYSSQIDQYGCRIALQDRSFKEFFSIDCEEVKSNSQGKNLHLTIPESVADSFRIIIYPKETGLISIPSTFRVNLQ